MVGCSKDDGGKGGDGIEGTVWECEEWYGDGYYLDRLTFSSGNRVKWYYEYSDSYGTERGTDSGTYFFEDSELEIEFEGD